MRGVAWANAGAVLVLAAYLPLQVPAALTPRKLLPDFFQDWGVAKNYADGVPLYGDQAATALRLLDVAWTRDTPLFRAGSTRPPAAAWLAVPLGWGDFHTAFRWWNGLQLAALGLILALLGQTLRPRWGWGALPPALAALTLWDSVGWGFREGQWSMFLAALLTVAWASARRGWFAFSGAAVGVVGVGADMFKI